MLTAMVSRGAASATTTTADAAQGDAAHGAHGEGEVDMNPLDPKRDLALWTGVVFLVLLAVLWKFAWGPIARGLETREQGIADQIQQADESNRQAKELLGQYEQKLADSKDEVREMLAQARQDAEKTGREMIDQAREDADSERQRALEQIDTAAAGAMKELAEHSANLAVELAGKIVQAELKPDDHAKLIRRTVGDFATKPSGNGG